jgi:Helix-turn-helix
MATRYRRDIERFGPWRASSKLPSEERPTRYTASGFQAARELAGMTQAEVAEISGYPVGVIAGIERGGTYHTLTVSRAASAIPGHDLSQIRDEGE